MYDTEPAVAMDVLESDAPQFLDGGGEMGARIRSRDWSSSVLGSPHRWPAPLRTVLRMMLTTNHPVFIFWGDEHTCFYNDAYAASLGPEKHPRMLGLPGRVVWNEIWPVIGPQIEMVRAGRGSTWHEDHLVPITRYGKVEDVYWTYGYGPIHDEDAPNCIGGVLVLCHETTNRVLEDARIRAGLDRYRLLFEQSPGFICVLRGPDHRFEYCNPSYRELIGREDGLVGQRVADILPEVVSQGYLDLLDQVYTSGEAHAAFAARMVLNQSERLVDFVYQPLRDSSDMVTGIFVQGVDVTKREQAQAALLRSASRLRIAAAAANLGIHEYDIRNQTIQWDARVREIWGVTEATTITYDLFMNGIVEADRELTQRAVDRALDPQFGGMYQVEYRVRDTADVVRWIRATGRVEFQDAQAIRLVGTVQDVSDEKRHEEELIEADRRKDVFLATLAHELRNPLAPIRNAAQILAVPGLPQAQLSWAQQVIERQSAHMATLLDDLLDVARLTQGRLELKREIVELSDVLASAVESVQPQLSAKGHRLEIHVARTGIAVFADQVRLCQVFSNLLGNAIKYTEPGGLVTISANVRSDEVTVLVRDTGIGLSASALPRVFGMFEQSEASLEHAEGGLGIGLALVRAIVELHGGTARAFSEGQGRGSEFAVILPLAPATPENAPAADGAVAPRALRKRILVADDNRDAADSLSMLLELHGHEVQVAVDGLQTLDMVETFAPDIVLMDIGMPRMNGYDVARAIRAHGGTSAVRLIALTGWGQAGDRERAFEAGFDAHLTKPPNVQALLNEIAR